MALNSELLGAELMAAIDQVGDKTDRQALFRAMAAAIVDHVRTNAQVTVTVTSVSGVTTGAGVSGPGTGTGTIT
jgi:hypothetical protein